MKLYKLTDKDGNTENNTHWEVGTTHTVEIEGPPVLCTGTVIHAYTSPLLAELMDNKHACFGPTKRIFECEGEVVISDGLKVGVTKLTILCETICPTINTTQHIAFGILCALKVCNEDKFTKWGQDWLNGTDRTVSAAYAAVYAAATAASAAAYAAAAHASSYPQKNAASYAASYAADAAVVAAAYAANSSIDFVKLAEQAMEIK